jgi:hypothetical protein
VDRQRKVKIMKAIIVYESHWGNTSAIARAIAEGVGPEARALSTAEATGEVIAGADLIVAGAPLLGFSLPTDSMLKNMASNAGRDPRPPDLAHPSMRAWLDALPANPPVPSDTSTGERPPDVSSAARTGPAGLPKGSCRAAAFETRIWWSPGSAAKTILGRLEAAGYQPIAKAQRFIVKGKYGPLRDGELEKAKAWGAELAAAA